MTRLVRAAVAALAATLAACTVNAGLFGPDGGVRGDVDCGDAGPDAGPDCAPGLQGDDPCGDLVTQCCGETCAQSAGCEAATLLQTYEPDQCAEALTDTRRFPRCELGNCDSLVARVCGDDDRCADAPGCPPAQELKARANDPDASQDDVEAASSECLQALEDDVVFAACP